MSRPQANPANPRRKGSYALGLFFGLICGLIPAVILLLFGRRDTQRGLIHGLLARFGAVAAFVVLSKGMGSLGTACSQRSDPCAAAPSLEAFAKQTWGTCIVSAVTPQTCTMTCGGQVFSTSRLVHSAWIDGTPRSVDRLRPGMEVQYWGVLDSPTLLGLRAFTVPRDRKPEVFRNPDPDQ